MEHQDVVDSLLSLGMQRRKLSFQELNEALSEEFPLLEELEQFLRLIERHGVKVIYSFENSKKKVLHARS